MRDRYFTILQEKRGGEPPGLSETHALINAIPDKRVWLFAVLAYLFAGRIEEIIRFHPPRWKFKWVGEVGKKVKFKVKNTVTEDLQGVRRKDFHVENYVNQAGVSRTYLVVTLRNLKNGREHFKKLTCRVDKEAGLVKPLLEYLEGVGEDEVLLDYCRSWMSELFSKYAGESLYHPHFLRGLRLTHLVVYYGFNEQVLVQFAGWRDGRPAARYMMFSGKALMEQMSK